MWRAGLILLTFCCAVCGQAPCTPTVVGRLEPIHFESKVFHNARTAWVWLPPAFDAARRYPVLYILDGKSAFDGCAAYHNEELRADETLTELIGAAKIPALIAVGVDNGSDVLGGADDSAARAREFLPYYDPFFPPSRDPMGAAYPDFLEKDVMPAVAAKYPVASGRENAALWGASYGGVAAVNILVHRPELFGRMIIESPSVEVGNGQILRDTMGLVLTPARIAVGFGTKEAPEDAINTGFFRAWKQLVENLKNAHIAPQVQLNMTEGGTHDTKTFGTRLADALVFVYGITKPQAAAIR